MCVFLSVYLSIYLSLQFITYFHCLIIFMIFSLQFCSKHLTRVRNRLIRTYCIFSYNLKTNFISILSDKKQVEQKKKYFLNFSYISQIFLTYFSNFIEKSIVLKINVKSIYYNKIYLSNPRFASRLSEICPDCLSFLSRYYV